MSGYDILLGDRPSKAGFEFLRSAIAKAWPSCEVVVDGSGDVPTSIDDFDLGSMESGWIFFYESTATTMSWAAEGRTTVNAAGVFALLLEDGSLSIILDLENGPGEVVERLAASYEAYRSQLSKKETSNEVSP